MPKTDRSWVYEGEQCTSLATERPEGPARNGVATASVRLPDSRPPTTLANPSKLPRFHRPNFEQGLGIRESRCDFEELALVGARGWNTSGKVEREGWRAEPQKALCVLSGRIAADAAPEAAWARPG